MRIVQVICSVWCNVDGLSFVIVMPHVMIVIEATLLDSWLLRSSGFVTIISTTSFFPIDKEVLYIRTTAWHFNEGHILLSCITVGDIIVNSTITFHSCPGIGMCT